MGYVRAEGKIEQCMIDAAIYGVIGNWTNWLAFNLKRCLNNEISKQEQKLGEEQVQLALKIILEIYKQLLTIKHVIFRYC